MAAYRPKRFQGARQDGKKGAGFLKALIPWADVSNKY
jgi:hypothetical protein